MLMSPVHADTASKIDTQRCAEQVHLDVVRRQSVAGQQCVEVSEVDNSGEVWTPAGMDYDWSGDKHDAPVAGSDAAHFPREFFNSQFDPPLARNAGAHEGELILTSNRGCPSNPHTIDATGNSVTVL